MSVVRSLTINKWHHGLKNMITYPKLKSIIIYRFYENNDNNSKTITQFSLVRLNKSIFGVTKVFTDNQLETSTSFEFQELDFIIADKNYNASSLSELTDN